MKHTTMIDDRPGPNLDGGFCLQVDPVIWHEQIVRAKRICNSGCPVKDKCLEAALDVEETEEKPYGVYGGLDATQRRAILMERRAQRRDGAA